MPDYVNVANVQNLHERTLMDVQLPQSNEALSTVLCLLSVNCEIYTFTLEKPCPVDGIKKKNILLSIVGGDHHYSGLKQPALKQAAEIRIAHIERLTTPVRSSYPPPTHFFYGDLLFWLLGTESHMERSGLPPSFHTRKILGTMHVSTTNGNLIGGKLIPALNQIINL